MPVNHSTVKRERPPPGRREAWQRRLSFVMISFFSVLLTMSSRSLSPATLDSEIVTKLDMSIDEHSGKNLLGSSLEDDAKSKIGTLVAELQNSALRYYVYDDPLIESWDHKEKVLRNLGRPIFKKRYMNEALAEINFIEALKSNRSRHFRVQDSNLADLFLIPFSLGATLIYSRKTAQDYDSAFGALYKHPIFQSSYGHRHVLFSLLVPFHKYSQFGMLKSIGLTPHYKKLWNVTVATDTSWAGCQYLKQSHQIEGNDFQIDIKNYAHHMSRYGFSMGLAAPHNMPISPATYEKFQNATFFIFYHTREEGSMFNSTAYRRAPLLPEVTAGLPKSSIGYDISQQEWMQHYRSSKFCLVIRGDTVHTHSLLRSVKFGCIPVVVADLYPNFAPTFSSTIRMEDYCIMLDESSFLRDPLKELSKIQDLTEDQIKEKLQWLAFAQRIFFTDHPESLFVPTFVKEAHRAHLTDLGPNKFPY